MSELMSGRRSTFRKSPQLRQSGRFVTSSAAWASATTVSHRGPQHLQHQGPTETEQLQLSKEEKEEAECQRKFRAVPVPGHVFLPLYDEMSQVRQKERKEGHEQRRDFLLSMQKPFSFLERDEKKREKLMEMISMVAQTQKPKATNVRKPIPKAIKDPAVSEHLKGALPKKISLEMLLRYRKWCYKCIIILSKSIFFLTEFCMLCRGGAAQDDMHPAEGPGELEEVHSTSHLTPHTQLPAY